MLECHFIDYQQTADISELSVISEQFRAKKNPYLLSTCHRIEFYGPKALSPFEKGAHNINYLTVRSRTEMLMRLAEIAAGTKSQILGEWAIYSQVKRYIEQLPPNGPIKEMGMQALRIARALREKYGFDGPDHATLAIQDIRERSASRILLVIGSGMLGQRLISHHRELGYQAAYLVSRSPKKARKSVRRLDRSHVKTLHSIDQEISSREECDVVIASSHLTPEYGDQIRDFVLSGGFSSVLDMCAISLLTDEEATHTLHGLSMSALIKTYNSALGATVGLIREEISHHLSCH